MIDTKDKNTKNAIKRIGEAEERKKASLIQHELKEIFDELSRLDNSIHRYNNEITEIDCAKKISVKKKRNGKKNTDDGVLIKKMCEREDELRDLVKEAVSRTRELEERRDEISE